MYGFLGFLIVSIPVAYIRGGGRYYPILALLLFPHTITFFVRVFASYDIYFLMQPLHQIMVI